MHDRDVMPQRRASETFGFTHAAPGRQGVNYTVTIGFYDHAMTKPGEVFLNAEKLTTDLDIAARDSAILLSYALQLGADPASISLSMARDEEGRPLGVMGTLLDLLVSETDGKRMEG